jgi:hypothetical protein
MHIVTAFVSRWLRRLQQPMARAILAGAVFAAVNGGCGGQGTASIFGPVPAVLAMHWVSIASGTCTGSVTNVGGQTAQDVTVFFYYSTAQGDTALSTHVGSVAGGASVVVHAPPQITGGESRFPDLAGFSYAGSEHQGGWGGRPPLHVAYYSYPCLVGPDSARVWIRNDYYGFAGLAFHVVLNVEYTTGVAQVPLRQTAVGPIVVNGCAAGGAQGCDGWGNFHLAVRDSAGIKLLPRIISMRWENGVGVADSLVLPNPYYGYDFEQYGVLANCPP